MNKLHFKHHKWLLLIFTVFGLIFASLSFVNHYNFRTYGWDLGINQNAIFDYAHLRWNDCMIMQPSFKNVLADHFSLYPLIISPLYWIFGSYTMLIFQWAAILFGGLGVFRFVDFISKNKNHSTGSKYFCKNSSKSPLNSLISSLLRPLNLTTKLSLESSISFRFTL